LMRPPITLGHFLHEFPGHGIVIIIAWTNLV
jgi:hypothetical protein